jgi:ABC-type nitrate/sulfonate/bicarbonate transport system substrate-binding protein
MNDREVGTLQTPGRRPRILMRRARSAAVAAIVMSVVAACGQGSDDGGSTKGADGNLTVRMALTTTELPIKVAADETLFEGVNVQYDMVGFDAKTPIFLKDKNKPVTGLSPIEVGQLVSEGEEAVYFSTAGGAYFINGIIIRAEDADRFKTVADLKGKKLGQPGFGTGTWAQFAGLTDKLYGINAKSDFDIVTADPGALLGLLESKKIDAALTFTGQTATGMGSPKFELLTSLGQLWADETGQQPLVDGLIARPSWVQDHPDEAKALAKGVDAGVDWIKNNPDEFTKGGKYEDVARDAGWLKDKDTESAIFKLIAEDKFFAKSDLYTDAWIDANYSFLSLGMNVLKQKVPPKEDIFAK